MCEPRGMWLTWCIPTSKCSAAVLRLQLAQLDLHSDAGEGYSSFSDSDGEAAPGGRARGPGLGPDGSVAGSCLKRLGAAVEVWPWDAGAGAALDAGARPWLRSILLLHKFSCRKDRQP